MTAFVELLREYGPKGSWVKKNLASKTVLKGVKKRYDRLGGKEGVGCTWDDLKKRANEPEFDDGQSLASAGGSSTFVSHQECVDRENERVAAIKVDIEARSHAASSAEMPPPYSAAGSLPSTFAPEGTGPNLDK